MLVKVVNDNVHPYSEKYKGKMIHIPAKGSIEMDLNEAAQFLGTNPGIARTEASGLQDPTTYKMLRIEQPGAVKAKVEQKFVCMMDGKEFFSQSALDTYILENHASSLVDEDGAREQIQKKKTGRPKKDVKHDASSNRDGGTA